MSERETLNNNNAEASQNEKEMADILRHDLANAFLPITQIARDLDRDPAGLSEGLEYLKFAKERAGANLFLTFDEYIARQNKDWSKHVDALKNTIKDFNDFKDKFNNLVLEINSGLDILFNSPEDKAEETIRDWTERIEALLRSDKNTAEPAPERMEPNASES